MNQIVSSQSLLFITSIEIGIAMGIVFDLVRILRKIVKHASFLVQIEDILYWIVCGLIGFYMLYINNYAAIRPFVFIGILLGAILYFASFSIVFMKIATLVINYIKNLLKYLWKLLLIPINSMIKYIKMPLKYLYKQYEKTNEHKRRKIRKMQRAWYQKKADIRTERYIKEEIRSKNKKEERK